MQSKTTAPDQRVPRALPDIPGIDVQRGVALVGGDCRFYCSMLRKFVHRFADTAVYLDHAFADGREEDALLRVHAVKGIAGNLGFVALDRIAEDLEDALRNRKVGIRELLEKFQQILDWHLTAINRGLPTEKPTEPLEPETTLNRAKLKHLRECLQELDRALARRQPVAAKQVVAALDQQARPALWKGKIVKLTRVIDGYRFDEARIIHAELLMLLDEAG